MQITENSLVEWKKEWFGWPYAYLDNNKLEVPSISKIVEQIPDPGWDSFVKEVGEEKANQIRKFAGDRGTIMHKFLENYYIAMSKKGNKDKSQKYAIQKTYIDLKNKDFKESSINTAKMLFRSIIDSELDANIKIVVGLEKIIASYKYFYRGKYDLTYINTGNLKCITDFKASSTPVEKDSVKWKKYLIQLVGYWQAFEETTNTVIDSAELWIAVKNSNPQKIKIDKADKQKLFPYFKKLCIDWHKNNNQDLELLSNIEYKIYI